jgi:hypothetical protein
MLLLLHVVPNVCRDVRIHRDALHMPLLNNSTFQIMAARSKRVSR